MKKSENLINFGCQHICEEQKYFFPRKIGKHNIFTCA